MSATAPIEKPSGMARIWNNSDKEYREKFKAKEIVIPARGYVDMEYYEAVYFVGTFAPSMKDERGQWIKSKPLRLEKLFDLDPNWKPNQFVSHADGKSFNTEDELKEHLVSIKGKYEPQKDERLDASLAAQKKNMDEVLGKLTSVLDNMNERLAKLEGSAKPKSQKGRKKNDANRDNHSSETVRE